MCNACNPKQKLCIDCVHSRRYYCSEADSRLFCMALLQWEQSPVTGVLEGKGEFPPCEEVREERPDCNNYERVWWKFWRPM
jgi:hypothetical protein